MSSGAAHGAIISIAFLLAAVTLAAQDWEAFAAGSGSAQDPVLLSAMAAGDLQTALGICRGVSRRSDPSMVNFIQALTSTPARAPWRSELLLRILLEPLAEAGTSEDFRSARLQANASALNDLYSRIDDWKDAQLAAALVRIAPFAATPASLQAVMRVGARVIAELQKGNGLIPSEETALALDCVSSAAALRRPEMAELCMQMARLSHEPVLVKAARAAAATLLSLPAP